MFPKLNGTCVCLHDTLCERCRRQVSKKRPPTAVIIDSQTAKTSVLANEATTLGTSCWTASDIWQSMRREWRVQNLAEMWDIV